MNWDVVAWIVTLVVGLVVGVSSVAALIYQSIRTVKRRRERRKQPATGGFPIIEVRPAQSLANDGPGRYLIIGVVASTQTDIRTYIQADTLANAKVKAELRGIVVTDIVKQ